MTVSSVLIIDREQLFCTHIRCGTYRAAKQIIICAHEILL